MSTTRSQQLTKELWTKYFDGDKIKTVLLDCDGVIWHANSIIPGAIESIARLKSLGKRVILVSNNSSRSRRSYVEKCEKLGIGGIVEQDVVTTSAVLGDYLTNVIKFDVATKQIYVIGSQGIADELSSVGIRNFGVGRDESETKTFDELIKSASSLDVEIGSEKIGAVVIGFDYHISYPKILKAATYLKDPRIHYLATNDDEVFPSMNPNLVCPGTGAMVAMLSTAADRRPIIMGKPYEPMFDYIVRTYGLQPSETCMVGDTFRTDIQFGKLNGMRTLLVFTGNVVGKEKLENVSEEKFIPDFYCDTLGDLVKLSG